MAFPGIGEERQVTRERLIILTRRVVIYDQILSLIIVSGIYRTHHGIVRRATLELAEAEVVSGRDGKLNSSRWDIIC